MWHRVFALLLFLGAAGLAQELPEPGKPALQYTDGVFTEPRGSQASYTLGATMNVSWHTTYETSNLWLIVGWNFNSPVQLAFNTGQDWYQWQVSTDSKNSSEVYAFRVVDATGTAKDQKDGGFLSGAFWIEGLQTASSSTFPTLSRVSTSAAAPIATSEPVTSTLETSQTAESTAQSNSSGITEDSKVGFGVGLSVGSVGIVAFALGIWLYRRSKGKKTPVVGSTDPYFRMEESLPSVSQVHLNTHGVQPYNESLKWSGPIELEGRRRGLTPELNAYDSRKFPATELQG
ncbi:hypothetical protein F5Y04DRAFT_277507 [Hypomontagnella monticulosa]|nr:hypothetical protein F5Y04DRAFT_277507 [Hypomontagnella monticulosa]